MNNDIKNILNTKKNWFYLDFLICSIYAMHCQIFTILGFIPQKTNVSFGFPLFRPSLKSDLKIVLNSYFKL